VCHPLLLLPALPERELLPALLREPVLLREPALPRVLLPVRYLRPAPRRSHRTAYC
jgi:hypothetical protein